MAFILGNGITAVFTTSATDVPISTVYTFQVTGFSHSGGARAQIDTTTSTDSRRTMLPGLASVEEITLQIKYDSTATVAPLGGSDTLNQLVQNCGPGTLLITAAPSDACGTNATLLSLVADPMSFNFTVELDGIVEGDITFMVTRSA
tara:strand:+ start:966 stop:1406 length:441 start_codon:yes stop_codon:yes gene_type:complete